MVVPPDDDCGGKNDDDLLSLSPQTKDTYIEQCEIIKHRALSAILSEGNDEESQYFEDSEAESEYQEEGSGVTLIEGKKSSKKKKSKKQEKQERRIKKKEKHIGKGGACGTGEKACCAIF